jgi:hypothetical protein
MTVDRTKFIKIPIWLFSVLLPLLIAIVTSVIAYSASSAEDSTRIDGLEKNVDKLDGTKVDKEVFDLVLKKLDSIEKKLDEHINNKNTNERP